MSGHRETILLHTMTRSMVVNPTVYLWATTAMFIYQAGECPLYRTRALSGPMDWKTCLIFRRNPHLLLIPYLDKIGQTLLFWWVIKIWWAWAYHHSIDSWRAMTTHGLIFDEYCYRRCVAVDDYYIIGGGKNDIVVKCMSGSDPAPYKCDVWPRERRKRRCFTRNSQAFGLKDAMFRGGNVTGPGSGMVRDTRKGKGPVVVVKEFQAKLKLHNLAPSPSMVRMAACRRKRARSWRFDFRRRRQQRSCKEWEIGRDDASNIIIISSNHEGQNDGGGDENSPPPAKKTIGPVCRFFGGLDKCTMRSVVKGFCQFHYQFIKRMKGRRCMLEGCQGHVYSMMLCRKHRDELGMFKHDIQSIIKRHQDAVGPPSESPESWSSLSELLRIFRDAGEGNYTTTGRDLAADAYDAWCNMYEGTDDDQFFDGDDHWISTTSSSDDDDDKGEEKTGPTLGKKGVKRRCRDEEDDDTCAMESPLCGNGGGDSEISSLEISSLESSEGGGICRPPPVVMAAVEKKETEGQGFPDTQLPAIVCTAPTCQWAETRMVPESLGRTEVVTCGARYYSMNMCKKHYYKWKKTSGKRK